MGRLIVSAQVTVDGVMDQLEGWFDPTDESAPHGIEQLLVQLSYQPLEGRPA